MKKVINYKVQKEDWEELKNKAFKKLNANTVVDGFRKGKAPRGVFEKNFPGRIVSEAADMAIDKEYKRIILEDKVLPVLEPKVDLVLLSDEELEVNYTFITEPEVKLGEYKNLGLKKEEVVVTDEEVQEKINHILRGYAELVVKEEGSVQNGDVAVIDYEGFKDGVAFKGGKDENHPLEIGSGNFIPGFEEGIIGMNKGESKDLELTFPEEYHAEELKGQKVVFKVTVNEIKTRVIPELDEEFFEDLGMDDVNTKEELENKLREEIKEEKEEKAEHTYIDSLLAKAVSNMECEIDDEIVVAEAESMYDSYMHNMSHQGLSEALYLQYMNTTKENVVNDMKEEALRRLSNSYLLNAIVKEEKIEVSDEEVEKELNEIAEKHNVSVEEVKEALGGIESLSFDLKVRKAIDLMK